MAGGRNIKGITVEIGGDTTGLQKALGGVNKNIRDTQAELKDVNRLLKLDPGNTELLAQKQRLLTDAVEETKDKLETLKTAKQQADEQFARGDISQGQYDALQREIIETEQDLKHLEEQANSSSSALEKLGYAGDKLQAIGGKFEGVGQKMMGVSAGIAAVGTASVAAWNEMDEAYDTIAKGTGATGEALKDLQKSFDSVYSSIPAEAGAASSAIADINTRFGFTGEVLEDCSKKFLQFAEVNGTDVSTAVANVSRYMGDAGIEGTKYGEVLDQLTAASQASGLSVDKLSESLTKYGAPMRALGFETQEAIAIFAGWEKAGVNTDTAFSGMKKSISNWAKAGKDARVEFKKTLAEIEACPDIASATTKAIEVFGTKAGPDLADAIQGGRFAYEDFLGVLDNSSGQLEQTFNDTLDPIDDMKTSMQALKVAGAELGGVLLETIVPMLTPLIEGIRNLAQWFRDLSPGMQQLIVKIALFVAAIGPVLIVIGKMAAGIGAIMGLVAKLGPILSVVSGAVKGLGVVIGLITSPIGLVILAITALVAGFIYLWNTSEGFRNFWTGLWEAIKSIVSNAVEAIGHFFTETLPSAWDAVKTFFTGIPAWWHELWTGILNKVTEIWTNMITTVSEKVTGIKNAIVNGFNEAVAFITSLPAQAIQWGKDFINGLKEGITSGINGIVEKVKGLAADIRAFLHFSRPDTGPLRDYETWMPDFVKGLADGLRNSRGILDKAVSDVAGSMMISPQYTFAGVSDMAAVVPQGGSLAAPAAATATQENVGNITIPVYIGQKMLDEIIIDAQTRHNFRSGGR